MSRNLNPEQLSYVTRLAGRFRAEFHAEPVLVRAPGRINLIGEHTDYNDGLVLPAAINKNIYVAIGPRQDENILLVSQDYDSRFLGHIRHIQPSDDRWPNYILGVLDQLCKAGHAVSGFNMVVGGDIPEGAGLSSSAALGCGTAYGLNRIFGLGLSRPEIVQTANAAERDFVGVNCGIMDQSACVMGRKGHLMLLDCRTREHRYIPFSSGDTRIVLFDTRVKHELVASEYNLRREQCEGGVEILARAGIQIPSLRFADESSLARHVRPVDQSIYERCSYVVSEISRVESVCRLLAEGDLESVGGLMYETHDGLSRRYEVSCPELDFLVDAVRHEPGVLGSRMMGGGFGGCTINLVRSEAVGELVENVSARYYDAFQVRLRSYVADIGDGIGDIEL